MNNTGFTELNQNELMNTDGGSWLVVTCTLTFLICTWVADGFTQ